MHTSKRSFRSTWQSYLPGRTRAAVVKFAISQTRESLTERYLSRYGSFVQAGPFAGMEIPSTFSWGDGDRLPKLLGSYEAELHPCLKEILSREYELAVDVGCAEGYYAIGLARSMRAQTLVAAFDIDDNARQICSQAAEINGVSHRVKIAGLCSTETLQRLLPPAGRSFVLMDCEGAEFDLLRPDLVPALRNSDILIECHDWLAPNVTSTLRTRFGATHLIDQITEGAREIHTFPFLETLNGFERALAVCEFRPSLMHWLFCSSKG